MKLWILRPRGDLDPDNNPWIPWYHKASGFVVRAVDEETARELANDDGGAETGPNADNPWLDPEYSTCVELTPDGNAGVIIIDMSDA